MYDLDSPKNLNFFERKVYSQNGEDGILEEIFKRIGTTNKYCVEFGVEDGQECNSRYLLEKCGWTGLRMDGGKNNPPAIKEEFITAENINQLFKKYKVPNEPDLLSIDIDGNDYWVWRALSTKYRPRVMIVEYNASIRPTHSLTIPYNPSHVWDGTNYFGASLLALNRIATERGYGLVCCDRRGANAFFIRQDILDQKNSIPVRTPKEAYMPQGYGQKGKDGMWQGHKPKLTFKGRLKAIKNHRPMQRV